jgi:hypothetical protein
MIRILWILFLIGTLGAIWLLKRRHRKRRTPRHQIGDIHNRVFGPTFRELSGLPACTLDIGNGREVRDKIIRSVKRGIGKGLTPAMCADRIVKILRKDKLDWPSFDQWRTYIQAHPDRYASAPLRQHFEAETYFQTPEVEAYAATIYGYLIVAKNIQEMKQAGFKNVFWACRSQDACCDICASLNGRKMPIDMFMEMCLIHPCCNGMPGVDTSC